MNFNAGDIQVLVETILDEPIKNGDDSYGNYFKYCKYCTSVLNLKKYKDTNKKFKHDKDCPVLVAKKVEAELNGNL